MTPQGKTGPGSLLIDGLLLAFVVWYMRDALGASTRIENIGLIVPVGFVSAALLSVFIVRGIGSMIRGGMEAAASDMPDAGEVKQGLVLGLLALGILAAPRVGIDLTTPAFIAGGMVLAGARKPIEIALVSIGTSALLIWGFRALLPYYPLPTLVL